MIREYIVKISDEVMESEIADSPPELIRCLDCKYYTANAFANKDVHYGECHKLAIGLGVFTADDWFCASAERRTDDA